MNIKIKVAETHNHQELFLIENEIKMFFSGFKKSDSGFKPTWSKDFSKAYFYKDEGVCVAQMYALRSDGFNPFPKKIKPRH